MLNPVRQFWNEADEDRIAPRTRLRVTVAADGGTGGHLSVLLHDLSTTGLLFESDDELSAGGTIAFDLPDAGRQQAEIVWRSGALHGATLKQALSSVAVRRIVAESKVVFPSFGAVPGAAVDRWNASAPAEPRSLSDAVAPSGRGLSLARRAQAILALAIVGWGVAVLAVGLAVWTS